MRITSRHLRHIAVAVVLALFAILALWWGLWTLAATEFYTSIDRWIAAGRAEGTLITYDDRQSFGFPHRVVLRFTNVKWKNADGIAFHADRMDLSSLPWDKQVFEARFHGPTEIAAPLDADGRSLTLSGEEGQARVTLTTDGTWKLSRVVLLQAKIGRAPDVMFLADRLAAAAERPDKPPKDHTQPGLSLKGEAQNITLPDTMPAPFGPKMASLRIALRVMDEVPDFRRKDSVAVWNDRMGVLEFDDLSMEWGKLNLAAKGTLGFDDDLQPEGAFSSVIGNQAEVLKILSKEGFIPEHQAGILNSALALFAKPADGKSGIAVPVTVQLGGLFLGPVRIFVFPEIEWPKAAAADAAGPAAVSAPAAAPETPAAMAAPATETPAPAANAPTSP